MRRIITLSTGLLLAALPAQGALAASHHSWDRASTIGALTLGGLALGVPVVEDDWKGLAMAGGSLVVGGGTAYGLKQLVHERRPDGNGNDSFPSAHTSFSFSAAATLENRYGWKVGLPAFALASFVGAARVEAKRHHWYDVVAGAGIGTASGFLLTSRRDDGVRLTPWARSGGGGMALATKF
jgi:membrane-associated phospholipid phosphatase